LLTFVLFFFFNFFQA